MEPFRHHIFICDQQKPEGIPSCRMRGAEATIDTLRRGIAGGGLANEVQITTCGSLGLCERGPNMVVYPEGIWYSGVKPEDVAEIIEKHLRGGAPVERLVNRDPEAVGAEIRLNRDRMMAGLRAREAAGAVPDDLVTKIRGFQESRILLTALELDVFTAVGDGSDISRVASRIGADPRATGLLLDALVAIGLLEKDGAIYTTTAVSKRYFAAGGSNDARLAMMHYSGLWKRWSSLTEAVREGSAPAHQDMPARDEQWVAAFIAAMDRNAAERVGPVVAAVGASSVARMLDVGGGSGAYSIAFARANPSLDAVILDVPGVLPITEGHIRTAGLEGRITTRPGDLRTDALGYGYDLVLLSAICHSYDETQNRDLIRRSREALVKGGRLVIQDFMLDSSRTAPKSAALFSINMLVGTEGGRSYTWDEYESWLKESGFTDVRRVNLPGPADLIIATK